MKTLTLTARTGYAARRGHTASSTTPPAILLPFSHFFRRENLAVPNFGRTFAAVPTTAMLSAGHRSMLRISRVCNMARTVAGYIPSLSHIRLSSRYLIVALLDKVTVSRNQRVGSRFFMSASVPTNRMKTLTLTARTGYAPRRGHTASSTMPPANLLPFSHFFRRKNLAVPNFERTFAALLATEMLSAGHRSMLRISRVCNMARTAAGYIPSLSHIRLSSRHLIELCWTKFLLVSSSVSAAAFFMPALLLINRMKTLTLTARTGYAARRGHTVLFSAHIVSRLSGAVGCVAAAAVWFMALAMPADASVAYRTAIAVAAVVALVGLMTAAVTPDRKGGAR